jgi:alpha-L-fucosidase
MGNWLGKYGETIYGTRGGPWKPTKTLASTRTGDIIYLHLLGWKGETVTLPNIPRKILHSAALTGGTARVEQAADKISISIDPAAVRPLDHGAELLRPQETRRASQPQIDTIVKLKLDRSAMDLEPR